ncbi:hypothetical protein F2P56_001580 [Juglans regia]|uniref:Cytochrome P450 705A22-like n=2 Tax=Juglans regia TaxID=51240 RepID=A0A2I4HW02_JUGRE|nr:cytochrome P450 705A22-like [Juglans regia]KAF5480871.1 hypothetical protein F2P56_001580 [Juglans regia]
MADVQYYFLCFLLCLVSTFLLKSFLGKLTRSRLSLPPSPPALPLIGHLHLLGSYLPISLHNLSTKYGPLFYLRLGASRCIVVSSASVATEIFKNQDLTFSDHPKLGFADEMPYGKYGFFSAPYGDYWRFVKKLCMTELLSPRQLERSRGVREEELNWFLRSVLECAEKKEAIDVGAELMKFSNNTLCRMAMSTRCSEKGDEAEEIRELVKDIFDLGSKMILGDVLGPLKKLAFWLYGKEVMDVLVRFDRLLERMLRDHEDEGKKREHEDLMDILLKVHKDDKAEVQMTRTHLKALVGDLFIGGTGTSSEAILWTIAELINHPNAFNKLREEIKSVVGSTRLVEESDIPNLPYLQAVVKEGLRLNPPAPVVTRAPRQDCKLEGFDIPKKTMIFINLYTIMRDPNIWENPDEFWPERFLVSSYKEGKENVEETFQFLPFGAGRRACPGSKLGLSMLQRTIAVMVQCFDWKVGGDGEAKVNMEVEKGAFLHMVHPLVCLPVVHSNPFSS